MELCENCDEPITEINETTSLCPECGVGRCINCDPGQGRVCAVCVEDETDNDRGRREMHEDITVAKFCDQHGACTEGVEWCRDNGLLDKPMSELWERLDLKEEWFIWIMTRSGVMPDRELRLFACWCARQVWHMLTDERSRNAVEVAERYAIGTATNAELSAARSAARSAAKSARSAKSAAESAAESAESAAESAVWSAVSTVWSAVSESARVARLREAGNPFCNDGRA